MINWKYGVSHCILHVRLWWCKINANALGFYRIWNQTNIAGGTRNNHTWIQTAANIPSVKNTLVTTTLLSTHTFLTQFWLSQAFVLLFLCLVMCSCLPVFLFILSVDHLPCACFLDLEDALHFGLCSKLSLKLHYIHLSLTIMTYMTKDLLLWQEEVSERQTTCNFVF